MSNIEPTEEQKQAARQTKPCGTCRGDYGRMSKCVRCDDTGFVLDDEATMRVARLLAEREAKLREELEHCQQSRQEEIRRSMRYSYDTDGLIAINRSLSEQLAVARSNINILSEKAKSENDTLRARVKELEARLAQYRERAHPADIHEIEMPDDAKDAENEATDE